MVFFGYMPRSKIIGSYDSSIFSFLRNLHTVLQEKAMALHSSILAWKIPWTEEPSRLQSMGSQRVGHDWATSLRFKPLAAWWGSCPHVWGDIHGACVHHTYVSSCMHTLQEMDTACMPHSHPSVWEQTHGYELFSLIWTKKEREKKQSYLQCLALDVNLILVGNEHSRSL